MNFLIIKGIKLCTGVWAILKKGVTEVWKKLYLLFLFLKREQQLADDAARAEGSDWKSAAEQDQTLQGQVETEE